MSDEKVNLNQATADELAVLPGIGQKLAAKIVAYRQEHGDFEALEDLSAIPGISGRMVGDLEERLTMGASSPEGESYSAEVGVKRLETEDQAGADETPEDESGGDVEAVLDAEDLAEDGAGVVITVSPEGEAVISEAATSDQDLVAESEAEPLLPAGESPVLLAAGDVASAGELPVEEAAVTTVETIEAAEMPLESERAESGEAPDVEAAPRDEVEPESIILLDESVSEQAATPKTMVQAGRESQSNLITGYILSAVAGAFLGAVLVLFFLLVVNGTLRFAGDSRANDFQRQMDADITTLNQNQIDLLGTAEAHSSDLQALADQLATVAADQAALDASQLGLQGDLASLVEEVNAATDTLADMAATVTALEEETAAMDERLARAAESAEAFDAFLNGMRDLLLALQGAAPETAGSPEPTASASSNATTMPGASPTPAPTRTPRPTATPLTLPTPTPRS